MKNKSNVFLKICSIIFVFGVWKAVSLSVNNYILLPEPIQVLKTLAGDIRDGGFWQTIFFSVARIGKGFLIAFVMGFIFGAVGYKFKVIRILIAPFINIVKSIPVASFVVLILIWSGSKNLSVWISFLVVLPFIYESTLAGFESTPKETIELKTVYQVRFYHRWFYLYRPFVLPYVINASGIAVGMAWKSGVAAELIGTPRFSIGEKLYMSKIMLDTASVLSWTIVVVLLSVICEKIFLCILNIWKSLNKDLIPGKSHYQKEYGEKKFDTDNFVLEGITKSFGEKEVLKGFAATLKGGETYALMGESGKGKTTLLRIIAGLDKEYTGTMVPAQVPKVFVFQKDIFSEESNALYNYKFLVGNRKDAHEELMRLLPEEALQLPMHALSGGMRRRVSIVIAMNSDGEMILMDEPFNGLDQENKKYAAEYILEKLDGRILFFTTHMEEDLKLLSCQNIYKI